MGKRNDGTAKIDADLLQIARLVADYRRISVAEYLSELIRDLVIRDLEAEQAKFRPPAPKGKGGAAPPSPKPQRVRRE
jgi:hypothetical protein